MNFSEALALLKTGRRITRKGWNGEGQFLYLVDSSSFQVNRPPLLGIYPEGTQIDYRAHIDMRTADGSCVPWVASQTDILAEDWEDAAILESLKRGIQQVAEGKTTAVDFSEYLDDDIETE